MSVLLIKNDDDVDLQQQRSTIGSSCPEVIWRHNVSIWHAIGYLHFGQVVNHHNIGWAKRHVIPVYALGSTVHRLNPLPPIEKIPFELITLTPETLSYFAMKTAWFYLQLFCHNTLAFQMTDDRLFKNYAWNPKGFPLNFVIKLNVRILVHLWQCSDACRHNAFTQLVDVFASTLVHFFITDHTEYSPWDSSPDCSVARVWIE